MSFTVEAGTYFEGCLWYSPSEINGLFKYNIATNVNEKVAIFPGVDGFSRNCHTKCVLKGTRIFFLPNKAKSIHIYNLNDGSITSIPFNDKVIDAVTDDNYIWMICGDGFSDLYLLDTECLSIDKVSEYKASCENKLVLKRADITRRISLADNKIWFAVLGDNKICSWDILTHELEIESIGATDIFAAYKIDDTIWITDRNSSKIFCIDRQHNFVEFSPNVSLRKNKNSKSHRYYNNVCKYYNGVLFIPANADRYVYINCEDNTIKEYLFDGDIENGEEQYKSSIVVENGILVFPFGSDKYAYFDLEGNSRFIHFPEPNDILLGLELSDLSNKVLCESEMVGLNEFIKLLK